MGIMSWLSNRRAGSDRSPWGDFWFTPVGRVSSSGIRVDADNAMRHSAVYSCVRVLAESFAVSTVSLYKRKTGGGRTKITDHWLHRLFNVKPNRFQTPFEFKEMIAGHIALRGNSFCEIIDDGLGGIAELMPLHPDRVLVELLDNGSYRYRYRDRNGNEHIYRRDQIWHLRGLSSDGIVGMNPIELQRESIASGLGAQDYGNRFFANDAKPTGGWIEFAGKFADKESRQAFRDSWQAANGGNNRGKVAVLENGMKYHEIGINNRDSQFLETRQFNISDIARIFRVPPHLVGDLTKATFSNIEQQSLDFVIYTMMPWGERGRSSLQTNLLGEDSDIEVEVSFKILLRGDQKSRSDYYHNGILDGWLTRNEAREEEGKDPLPGLDEPLRPLNMVEESETDNDGDGDPETQDTDLDPEDTTGMDARLIAVAKSAAERVARKELNLIRSEFRNGSDAVAAAYAGLAKFVASCTGVDESEAKAYCDSRINEVSKSTLETDFLDQATCKLERLILKGTV